MCKFIHTCSPSPRGSLSSSFISPSSWQVSKRNLIISSMFNLLQCCLSKAQASTIHLASPKQTKSKSQVTTNKLTISWHINYMVHYIPVMKQDREAQLGLAGSAHGRLHHMQVAQGDAVFLLAHQSLQDTLMLPAPQRVTCGWVQQQLQRTLGEMKTIQYKLFMKYHVPLAFTQNTLGVVYKLVPISGSRQLLNTITIQVHTIYKSSNKSKFLLKTLV